MQEGDTYCGFLCDDIIERQQAIINDLKDFSKYNHEFSIEMARRVIEMCIQCRMDIQNEPITTTTTTTTT